MNRKKGFTVVELVMCFVLISIIVIGMLTIALNYRKNVRESAVRVKLEEYKINITRKIQNDITNLGVNYIKYCDTAVADCIEIIFNNGTSKKIEVEALNPTNRYIKYGGEKFMIEDDLKEIENPTLKDVSTLLPLAGIDLSVSFQNNSSIYKIDIPITHTEIEGDYGIHITTTGTGTDPGVYVSTVTFDPTGGTEPSPKKKTVTFMQPYGELPTTEKNYYNFDGWYPTKTSTKKVNSATLVNKIRNHTLYARWSPKSYVVTFNANGGGTPSKATMEVTYGNQYGTLATISRTGYTFDGWYTQASGGTKITSDDKVNEHQNHTLYAQWKVNTYNIAYTLNGGSSGTNVPTSAIYDTRVTISNPAKTVKVTGKANGSGATVGNATSKAQTFAGWTSTTINTSTARYGTNDTAWTNGNSKVTATKFKNLKPSGTVTLVANWTPESFNLPTVTKRGYTCKWYENSAGTGTSYKSGGSYTPSATSASEITLYAKCTANKYTIVYNANGGSGTMANQTATYNTNHTISSNTFTKTGYTFGGWTTNSSGVDDGYNWTNWSGKWVYTNDQYGIKDGKLTLYARWDPNKYTVTFNANGGGTPSKSTMEVTYGNQYGTLATISRTGYTFNGWYTAASGGTKITSTSTYSIDGNQTLYARWKSKDYIFLFKTSEEFYFGHNIGSDKSEGYVFPTSFNATDTTEMVLNVNGHNKDTPSIKVHLLSSTTETPTDSNLVKTVSVPGYVSAGNKSTEIKIDISSKDGPKYVYISTSCRLYVWSIKYK